MKKLLAILLTLAMLLSLAACGGETTEDPNAGKYMGTTAKAFGMTMEMAEIYPGETWLELKSGGKGTIMLDGDSFSAKWTLEGDTFTLTIDGEDSVGTLKNGVVLLDLMNMGVEMTFVKEGMEAPVAATTYNDAGYWEVVRVESEDPDSAISEEDMALAKSVGVLMYMELKEDGTGVLYMDEEMPITWCDGTVTITEDAMTVSYTIESGELSLDMIDMVFVFRKGAQTTAPESTPESAPEADVQQTGEAGLYEGTTYEYGGLSFAMTEIYKDRCTLELKNDGTAVLTLDSEQLDCTWTLDGETFSLNYYTVASPGTLKDSTITIDYMGTGMMMTFAKTGQITGGNAPAGAADGVNAFPTAFIADHEGDWHGMAIVYEGTGAFADEVDKEMEIIARLVFAEDGTCLPYLACAFGGKDNNFKNLKATYSTEEDVMILSGEFVNGEIVSGSNLFAQDGALYVDVYVEDAKGNTMNLYACLRPLDAAWDYDNDWLNLPQDAVAFYQGKSFLEIAELFQLDLSKIPELDGAAPVAPIETPTEAPAAAPTEAPAVTVSGFGGTSSYQIKESLSGIVTTVTVTLPDAMWIPDAADHTLYLYNVEKPENAYSNSPRIQFVVKQSLEKINFYLDTFENFKELDSRVIGGIEMQGRSYKTVGMEWIEYFAELPNGVWICVQTSRTSIEPGSEGSAILDSVQFG